MKITTLIENTQDEEGLLVNEHGLSIFIESSFGNILFDTGKTGAFVENAKKLNVDLSSIDTLILSHSHYDHCGGVKKLLETYNIKPRLVVSEDFFKQSNKYHYSDGSLNADFAKESGYSYIGIDFDEDYIKSKNLKIDYLKDNMMKINDEVFVFSKFKKYHDFEKENPNMMIKISDDNYIVDPFSDEISIGLKTKEGLVILLGCAHPGFLNITDSIREASGEKIVGIIGGTHLIEADDERINESVNYLNDLGVKLLGLSHCTGEKAVNIFNEKCSGTFVNRTGTIKTFE